MTARPPLFAGLSILALAGLGACASTRGSHSAAAPDSAPLSATMRAPTPDSRAASPEPVAPPPVHGQPPPAEIAPPEPAPPEPAPPEHAPPPQKLTEGQVPPDAAVKQVPPCIQVQPKPHRKRRRPAREPQGPEPPRPADTRTDTVVDAQVGQLGTSFTSILGKNVTGPKGENLGRVVDILADAEGRVRVAIIDFGGFLGVGTRRIAVDWPLLRFDPNAGDKSVILNVTREKLQSAPEYKDSTSPRVLVPPPAAASRDAADTGETKK
jgi:PRC-barrel domain